MHQPRMQGQGTTSQRAALMVRRVLAHSSIDTTTSFYTGFETAAASRHFDANILEER